jgi:hypothetical protein
LKSVQKLAWAQGVAGSPKFGGEMQIMRVTIQLPDDISAALSEQWDDVPRRSLEASLWRPIAPGVD